MGFDMIKFYNDKQASKQTKQWVQSSHTFSLQNFLYGDDLVYTLFSHYILIQTQANVVYIVHNCYACATFTYRYI